MVYEFIFLIPEIILGIGVDLVLILRFVKTGEIECFKGDINIGPLNNKILNAMSFNVKKKVTKITQIEVITMLISTIVVAIFFIPILRFSKWFVIPCIVIQFVLTLYIYRYWRREIAKCLETK